MLRVANFEHRAPTEKLDVQPEAEVEPRDRRFLARWPPRAPSPPSISFSPDHATSPPPDGHRTLCARCDGSEAAGEYESPAANMWLVSAFSSAIFLLSIVLSIPIAFDVGGRDAGLAYSLSLFLFYVFYSTSKFLTPERSRVRWFFKTLIGLSQWVVIPALLIWSLNRFSVDAGTEWVARTISQVMGRPKATTWWDWFFGYQGVVETIALGGWDNMLSYSSPVFQLLEGFCSLLVIQAAGQITRWLVNRGRSDTWVVSGLACHVEAHC